MKENKKTRLIEKDSYSLSLSLIFYNTIISVPSVIKPPPAIVFGVICSCKIKNAGIMVITILSLSIGTTFETVPSWIALK